MPFGMCLQIAPSSRRQHEREARQDMSVMHSLAGDVAYHPHCRLLDGVFAAHLAPAGQAAPATERTNTLEGPGLQSAAEAEHQLAAEVEPDGRCKIAGACCATARWQGRAARAGLARTPADGASDPDGACAYNVGLV